MTATIELPNNRQEVDFILEVLKRLNVRIVENTEDMRIDDDTMAEHSIILRERRAAMNAPDAKFFTWEEAQYLLANRSKKEKTIL